MPRRAGRAYQQFKAYIRHQHAITNQPCQVEPCLFPSRAIDYTLSYPHPQAWSLDHTQALHQGGHEFDPTNCQASHLRCNLSRGATEGNHKRKPKRWTSRQW